MFPAFLIFTRGQRDTASSQGASILAKESSNNPHLNFCTRSPEGKRNELLPPSKRTTPPKTTTAYVQEVPSHEKSPKCVLPISLLTPTGFCLFLSDPSCHFGLSRSPKRTKANKASDSHKIQVKLHKSHSHGHHTKLYKSPDSCIGCLHNPSCHSHLVRKALDVATGGVGSRAVTGTSGSRDNGC